jgi:hypothetical protein
MPTYCVIENNVIINKITAESLEDAEFATKRECKLFGPEFPYGPGAKFDGTKWIEEQPDA